MFNNLYLIVFCVLVTHGFVWVGGKKFCQIVAHPTILRKSVSANLKRPRWQLQAGQSKSSTGLSVAESVLLSPPESAQTLHWPLTSSWSIETDINVWGSDIIVKFLASTWSDSLLFLQKHRSLLNYEEKQLSRLGSGSLLANMRFVLCEEVRLDCPFYPESTK